MSTKGIMLSCMIYEMEGWDVVTDDIPGYFLQNDYSRGDIHINMEGEMLTLLENINPEY